MFSRPARSAICWISFARAVAYGGSLRGTFTLAMVAFVSAPRLYKGFRRDPSGRKGLRTPSVLDGMQGVVATRAKMPWSPNITLQTEAQILRLNRGVEFI